MEKPQLKALIDFHKKSEKAYIASGDLKKAAQAKQALERFEKELEKK